MEISELGTPMRAPIEAYIKRRGLLLLPRHRPESRFPDNVQSLKKAENSRFQHFQPLMGVWELGTYMQETQKSRPPLRVDGFWTAKTPGARNCSFSGVSVLPVNTVAGIPALGYASRDWVRSEVAVTESFRTGSLFHFLTI